MSTWGDVNRVSIDRDDPVLEEPVEQTPEENPESNPGQAVGVPEGMEVFLPVGSDSRDELEDASGFGDFAGQRADVVMVFLRPADGSRAALLSLPRDLLVENVQRWWRAQAERCVARLRQVNGPTALTLTVESVIGQQIDHFGSHRLGGIPGGRRCRRWL